MKNSSKRKTALPGWAIAALGVLALGVALCVFAFSRKIPPIDGSDPKMNIVNVEPSGTEAAAQITPPQATNSESDATVSAGDFSSAFPTKDTGAGADYSHQSDTVRVAVKGYSVDGVAYYVADVWIKNISSFRTAFAKKQYGQGIHQEFIKMAQDNKAIVAISGDYYSARAKGIVVRNGQLYRDIPLEDVCVLYQDGVMETYTKDTFNVDDAIARKAYQIWSFGPQLLEKGQPMQDFNSSVKRANPRCAIGYYEPGHYCFVTVDGRQPGYSEGISLQALSQLFYDLGCKAAYNLDGGQTAMMAYGNQLVNRPYNGGRESGDIIYISD